MNPNYDLPIPVVLISGVKNSGKNTFGDLLATALGDRLNWAVVQTAFADPIKDAVRIICGVPADVLWGNSDAKESHFVYGKSVRHILQWLGTEVFRDNLSEHIWVDATMRHIMNHDGIVGWVVTDCRFPNEWTRARDTLRTDTKGRSYHPWLIKVVRSACVQVDTHRSETEVSKLDDFYPIIVHNDGTLDDLKTEAEKLADFLVKDCHAVVET